MKKILITGSTGFVGSHLLEYLSSKKEYELFGTSYKSTSDVSEWIADKNLFELNLLDSDAVERMIKEVEPDYVVHLAALSSPKMSFDAPKQTISNNVDIQINIFEALLTHSVEVEKIIIVGSAEEYGLVREEDYPVNEQVELRPTSPYAISKIAQDFLGYQYFESHKLPVVRLRPFNHTGERRPETFVLPAFAKQVAEIEEGLIEPVLKVGNLSPVRDFTDVKDMVRAYELALLKCAPGDVYNVGSGKGVEIQKLLQMLLDSSEKEIKVEVDQARVKPADVPVLICDNTKFVKQTGWEPQIELKKTVERVLDYWRDRIKSHN